MGAGFRAQSAVSQRCWAASCAAVMPGTSSESEQGTQERERHCVFSSHLRAD